MGRKDWNGGFPSDSPSVSVSVCDCLSFSLDKLDMSGQFLDMPEMTLNTSRVLASVERRLNKVVDISACACGHESELERLKKQRGRLMEYLRVELEKLQQDGGQYL